MTSRQRDDTEPRLDILNTIFEKALLLNIGISTSSCIVLARRFLRYSKVGSSCGVASNFEVSYAIRDMSSLA